MKGYLVDAGKREITPVNYTYDTMRNWLPGGITVARMFGNGDVLYVDDEALLHPIKVAFRLRGSDELQPFVSNGLLTGRDAGNTTLPPAMSADKLAEQVIWMDVQEALHWFRSRAGEPAVVVTFGEGEMHVVNRWNDFLPGMEEKK